ncbi:MAG: glycosyltransferase family 4 protein [Anaerolineae bacterium]
MRIAFLAQRLVFPPDAGTPIRNYNLIARTAARHDVTAIGFSDAAKYPRALAERGAALHLLTDAPAWGRGQRLRVMLTSGRPDMAVRSHSPALLDLIERELPAFRPDIVQIQALDMAYAIPAVRRWAPNAAIVLDQHNAEYLLQRRAMLLDARLPRRWPQAAYSAVQWLRLRAYERAVCDACDEVVVVSPDDAESLARLGLRRRPVVVPNGVDVAWYRGVPPEPVMSASPGPHFVFPGKMDFRPNVDAAVWFAREVMPLLRAEAPEARFWVVGREPSAAVRALAQLPGVHVTGEVADTRPYLAAATAVVVPLRIGGGTKLKVLEAAALSRPLVLTGVAAEGYGVAPGDAYLRADTPADLARACLRVASDRDLARRLAESAYRDIALPFDWDIVFERLQAIYERLR